MPKFRVPDACVGFEMADGTKYDAVDGVVEVSDVHAEAVRRSHTKRDFMGGGLIMEGYRYVGATGWDCRCGFSAFNFTMRCPRCGSARPVPEEV